MPDAVACSVTPRSTLSARNNFLPASWSKKKKSVPGTASKSKKKEPPFSEEYFDNTRHAFSLGHRRYLLEDVCMSKGHCIINLVVLVSVDHHNFEDDDGEDCGWLPLLKDYHSNTNNRTKTVILESAHHCFHRIVLQPSDSG